MLTESIFSNKAEVFAYVTTENNLLITTQTPGVLSNTRGTGDTMINVEGLSFLLIHCVLCLDLFKIFLKFKAIHSFIPGP